MSHNIINNARAFVLGVRDGWQQPHYLSSSWNVDHLHTGSNNPYLWQDRGINVGQRIRSPRHHQKGV
jgi:hypothetical protein